MKSSFTCNENKEENDFHMKIKSEKKMFKEEVGGVERSEGKD
jgi:hypothetical protein